MRRRYSRGCSPRVCQRLALGELADFQQVDLPLLVSLNGNGSVPLKTDTEVTGQVTSRRQD